MSNEYERVAYSIDVPRETGVEGFIVAIREVLKQSRVQSVEIDARGKVNVVRFVRASEPRTEISVDFSTVTPAAAVRSGRVIEIVTQPSDNPLEVLLRLYTACTRDQMFPVALIIGADSTFPAWLRSFGYDVDPLERLYGQPVLSDRHVPDDALILATSYGPNGALADVQHCYKVALPLVLPVIVPAVVTNEEEITT